MKDPASYQNFSFSFSFSSIIFNFSAESRILEIHPLRTTHLAGGDNTLIVLLSILCPQEDSNPYLQVRSLTFYPLNYGDNLRLRTPQYCVGWYNLPRISYSHLTGTTHFLRVRNLWQTTNFYFHWVFRLYFQVLCSLYLWENCPFL